MQSYVAQMMQVAFNFAPVNWSLANGQTLAISQNTALFSLIGTTFGGNGVSTFQLPNTQSRFIVSAGQGAGLSNYTWGQVGGTEQETLLVSNMPAHTHVANFSPPSVTLQALTGVSNQGSTPVAGSQLTNTSDATRGATPYIYSPAGGTGTAVNLGGVSNSGGSVVNALTGNNIPFSILPPYLSLFTCICLYGVFPSRS